MTVPFPKRLLIDLKGQWRSAANLIGHYTSVRRARAWDRHGQLRECFHGRTSRSTVSLALAPDGSVHVALKLTSTPPPAALACPAPMEQPSAPPDARNWLMAPCMACSNAPNSLMGNVPTGVQGRLIVPETQIVTL